MAGSEVLWPSSDVSLSVSWAAFQAKVPVSRQGVSLPEGQVVFQSAYSEVGVEKVIEM